MQTKYDASLDFFIFDANAFHKDVNAKCPYDAHVSFQRCNFHDADVPLVHAVMQMLMIQTQFIQKFLLFSKKVIVFLERGLKRATLLLNQIVKINLLSQIIRFQVNTPFGNFKQWSPIFGGLKSKGRWLFMNNKSSFENILVSDVMEASFLKIKGIFE